MLITVIKVIMVLMDFMVIFANKIMNSDIQKLDQSAIQIQILF
jgi:hypothetical protein